LRSQDAVGTIGVTDDATTRVMLEALFVIHEIDDALTEPPKDDDEETSER